MFRPESNKAIWHYAKALGKSLGQISPADIRIDWGKDSFTTGEPSIRVECTIRTQQEAEAVREIILLLTKDFTSKREGIWADIHERPEPNPDPLAEMKRLLCIPIEDTPHG